ncbi:ATP-binding protein [Paenibacillus sp. MER TA 81-3]|uniref:AAA family ATPase n=1 Tax=Paenibacillus sp. MER TA 81-3 TaxID=2939573 RepID=UPI00204154F4|nr:AAA family ATPase [Paenibacillus sp. MER TA 81-3]MCM3340592.1 ATP-binding protein [Paenibacillus sp. MER TA 81-3]
MKNIIFISGVHGVGKTQFCRELTNDYQLIHHTASQLIASKKQKHFDNSKRVSHITENQDYLIEAINELELLDTTLLLDGHFCVINEFSNIVRLPIQTFSDLLPRGIILLTDDEAHIHSRLVKRDSIAFIDIDMIRKLQQEELIFAQEISNMLHIPLCIYRVSDNNRAILDDFVEKFTVEQK